MNLRPGKSLLGFAALFAGLALPAQAITNATPTTDFEAVGRGVQVAPDWVLTVYHYAFGVGDLYGNGYGSWVVAARYNAPGSGSFPANDLSLLRLVPDGRVAPYLAVNGAAVPDGSFAPVDVTISSTANSGPARGYGYTTVSESLVMIDPDDSGPEGPVLANWLVSRDASVHVEGGDSGGGLFLGHVIDSSVLLGLSSGLLTDENDVPTGSGFVQPAAYRSWIDATMSADPFDTQTVAWVAVSVPEPAGWLLGAAGLALLFSRRRRRA